MQNDVTDEYECQDSPAGDPPWLTESEEQRAVQVHRVLVAQAGRVYDSSRQHRLGRKPRPKEPRVARHDQGLFYVTRSGVKLDLNQDGWYDQLTRADEAVLSALCDYVGDTIQDQPHPSNTLVNELMDALQWINRQRLAADLGVTVAELDSPNEATYAKQGMPARATLGRGTAEDAAPARVVVTTADGNELDLS